MKRVLIFSLAYYPHMGGAEVAVKETTDRIKDIEFHMVTMRFSASEKREERIGNVMVHRVGVGSAYLSKVLFVPLAAITALRLHKKTKFDALWAMMSYMLFPVVLMRMGGVTVSYVLTLQDGDPFEHVFNRWYIKPFLLLLRSGFRNASVVQTISHFLAGWARRAGYLGHVEVVPNGVDVQKFSGTPIAHEGVRLITTSRLVHKNAVDVVIRALALLPSSVHFLILGGGTEEQSLKMLAKELGVETRLQFLGPIPHDALPIHLHAADIFVRPSRSEGMGNSFIEAFAAELPVIATQEGGIADFLFDAKRNPEKPTTGWAVDANSPEQVALAVQEILGNKERAAQVIQTAKALAVEKYDWNIISKDIRERVFARVL